MASQEEEEGKEAVLAGHCLLSAEDTSPLLAPIQSAPRIRYTCVATSEHYIALGANTGGVYCFHRHGYHYIRILSNQEGGVSQLRFSPAESALAVCCGGEHVILWDLNLAEQGMAKRVHVSTLCKDGTVTAMLWDSKSSRLFFGDDQGRVAVSYMPKNYFKKPDELLHHEKAVVQMDLHQDLLLVSTVSRCYILNVVSREVVQVGKRQREGEFGACFHAPWSGKPPMVYSARPGGRLWEADVEGTVLSTLRLKELITQSATPLRGYQQTSVPPAPCPTLPLHFTSLAILDGSYLACWASGCLYLFHTTSYQLVGWTEALGPEALLHCDGHTFIVLTHAGRQVHLFKFADVSTSIKQLVKLGLISQAQQVLESHHKEVEERVSSDPALVKACAAALPDPSQEPLPQHLQQLAGTMQEYLKHCAPEENGVAEENKESGHQPDTLDTGDQANVDSGHQPDTLDTEDQTNAGDTSDKTAGKSDTVETDFTGTVEVMKSVHCAVAGDAVTVAGGAVTVAGSTVAGGTVAGDLNSANTHTLDQPVSAIPAQPSNHLSETDTTGECDTEVGGPPHTAGETPVITINVDFPSGPSVGVGHGEEPDLESTLVPGLVEEEEEKEELTSSSNSTSNLLDSISCSPQPPSKQTPPSYSSSPQPHLPLSKQTPPSSSPGVDAEGSTMSVPASTEGTPDSTPSSSVSKSLGYLSRVSADSAADSLRLNRGLSAEGTPDDDVIAVPLKSLSGKGKSKKKSRRKKTPSPSPQIHPQNQQPSDTSGSSLPKSSSLVYMKIPEEDLPFPEVGLPVSIQSSPSTSHNPSPFPSLPSTPPESRTPPKTSSTVDLSAALPALTSVNNSSGGSHALPDRADSHTQLSQLPLEAPDPPEKHRTLRSHSVDIPRRSSVSGALSKVKSMAKQTMGQKGQKVVKGFFSSLSSSGSSQPHDLGAGPAQPILYRNSDVQYPPSSDAVAIPTSPSSSIEQGEFATMVSPLSDHSEWLSSTSPPPSFTSPPSLASPPPVYIPHPDTAVFLECTTQTLSELEKAEVLCCPKDLHACLASWLRALHVYRSKLVIISTAAEEEQPSKEKPPSILSPPSPYSPLTPAVVTSVTHLATLCAELAVYSDEDKTSTQTDPTPENDGLEEFIASHVELLDWSRTRCRLAQQPWHLRERGWWALLKTGLCTDVSSLDPAQVSSLTDHQLLSLLLHTPNDSDTVLTLALSSFPRLMPWEVAFALTTPSTQTPRPPGVRSPDKVLFVTYLSRLLDNKETLIQRSIVEEVFESDLDLLTFSLSALLDGVGHLYDHTHTAAGLPKAGSHMVVWEHQESVDVLVGVCCGLADSGCTHKALLACQRAGYWLGVIRLLVAMGDRKTAITTVLALGDLKLLTQPQSWGHLLGSTKDWMTLIARTTGTTSSTTPNVRESGAISSEQLFELLSSRLPSEAVRLLLDKGCGLEGDYDRLYTQLVETAALRTQQRAVAHGLLEKVDRYLWSPRPSALGPHLNSTLTMETAITSPSTTATKNVPPIMLHPLPPSLEEVGMHWGVRTTASTCSQCRLQLTTCVSERSPGVLAFLCGHAFHRNCVPESACTVCFATNLRATMNLQA